MVSAKGRILDAAIKGVRLYGLEGVRMQHIAKLAGTASGNIYSHFGSKDELLRECFDRVDRQIAHVFDRLPPDAARLAADPAEEIRRLWTPYYQWLIKHPDETVFYHRYRDSPNFLEYYREKDLSYFRTFIGSVQLFQDKFRLFDRIDRGVFWSFVLSGTVFFAKGVIEGELPNTKRTQESIFQLMLHGIQGLLYPAQGPDGEGSKWRIG